jgi:hypothetical protein
MRVEPVLGHGNGVRALRRILWALAFLLSPALVHAQCTVTSGASTSAIQTAVNQMAAGTCPGPLTHQFNYGAGSYSITSQINIPCPTGASIMQGPVQPTNVWPIVPTAILTGTLTNQHMFHGNGCSNGVTIQFVEFNGNDPSGGGGGALFVPATMNNLTFQYNYVHGNSAVQSASNLADSLVWLDGSNVAGSPRTTGATIRWNRFGHAGSSDCANLMNVIGAGTPPSSGDRKCAQTGSLTYPLSGTNVPSGYGGSGTALCMYQDNDTEKNVGGFCNAVGVHVNVDNLVISNNSVDTMEQGFKFFEGCTNFPCPDVYKPGPITVTNNDMANIHRIGVEAQQGGPGPWTITGNSIHDEALFSGASWAWSLPQNGGGPFGVANTMNLTSNLILQNNTLVGQCDKSGFCAVRAFAVEWWSPNGSVGNDLIQGFWGGGVAWGFGSATSSISNNNFQQLTNYFNSYTSDEENQGCCSPTISGNNQTHTVSTLTSVAPTISPAAGNQTFPLTVTLTDPGLTSGVSPLGNTGIWYTTDGSSPVPGAGTAKYLASGGTFSLPAAATVKAVGMWGALNQPTSYAAGNGFVPSAAVSSAFTAAGLFISPTGSDANPGSLASPWLTPNHAMACGQVITAVSGTYSASNFQSGNWGTVTCPGANDVAWLKCQTFDTCKITSTSSDGMWVSKSFWGVQGWEVSVTGGTNGACFHAGPTGGSTIHHIIFANDVANGCKGGGFNSYDASTSASVDYITYIGNVAYSAASGTGACYSGFNIYQPLASDTNSGTHMYVAGNFSYNNVDGSPCSGGLTTKRCYPAYRKQ